MANVNVIDPLFALCPPEEMIALLSPMLTPERQQRIGQVLEKRLHSVQVAIENPYDIHNAFAVMRSCEAFGINQVHIIGRRPSKRKGKSTTSGAYRWVDLRYHSTLTAFHTVADPRLRLTGACMEGSFAIHELPVDQPICLFFGNEHEGLSPEALEDCSTTFRIPMCGMTESLNLSVAAAISIFDVVRRRREYLGQESDLHGEELLKAKARYYIRSLGYERVKKILNHTKAATPIS